MTMYVKALSACVFLLLVSAVSVGAPGLTITGTAVDSSGRPIPDATVMVYHAGVLNGYSTFCPSCYRDCGKRTKTDSSGSYTIPNLASGLWFDLLLVSDGYAPEIVRMKDISAGAAPIATLKARSSVADPSHAVKGHVVDAVGRPVPDVVVTTIGFEGEHGSAIGTFPGLDPLAVTDQNGNFEIDYTQPAKRMLVTVESRTRALRFATLVTGPQSQKIELEEGATVRGRLMLDGKPVTGAEVGLIGQQQGGYGPALSIVGDPYPETRIGTRDDGTFVISNVPTGVHWFVYPKMESVATKGSAEPKICVTARPREIVDVGEISLGHGYRLRGRIILNDGKPLHDGMRVILISERVRDTQVTLLDKDGRFEFLSLPNGDYSMSPSIRGYSVANNQNDAIHVSIQRNIDDFIVSLDPTQPER
jgi:Carboxypeptidase regulatory-like domain